MPDPLWELIIVTAVGVLFVYVTLLAVAGWVANRTPIVSRLPGLSLLWGVYVLFVVFVVVRWQT